MTTLQLEKLGDSIQIDNKESKHLIDIILDSMSLKGTERDADFVSKEELIDSFSGIIELIINNNFSNKKEELFLISVLDKLNLKKEILELALGETNIKDIKAAGKRLGKKSQSGFETK
ncbi:hypothetical protein D3C87_1430800 [compost metagenome]